MNDFKLDPRLEADTYQLTDLSLCRILLMNDSRYPWLILVPRQQGLREFHDLSREDQSRLMSEITRTAKILEVCHQPDKLNIGALGNIVNQLHIHVLGRFDGDPAWPGPVWGIGEPVAYFEKQADALIREFRAQLGRAAP